MFPTICNPNLNFSESVTWVEIAVMGPSGWYYKPSVTYIAPCYGMLHYVLSAVWEHTCHGYSTLE